MSDFDMFGDFEPEKPPTLEEDRPAERQKTPEKKSRQPGGIYNLIAFVFLLGTIGVIAAGVFLALNPDSPYNPLPPNTPIPTPTLFVLGEAADETPLPATPSPAPTETVSTVEATATETRTPMPSPTGLTEQPGATNTVAVFPFTLQDEAVTYTQNFNEEDCAWLSIAGQVFDLDGDPLPGLPVQVTGENFERIVFTGTAVQYGPSGYEVFLNSTPIEAEFVVRLLNTTGMPLSEPIVVRTLSSCDRNVAIVNFIQNHEFSN